MKYVLFLVESQYRDAVYGELFDDENIIFATSIKNPFINKVRNMHTAIKINRVCRIPFQCIWYRSYFNELSIGEDEECIFLFEEGTKQSFDQKYLWYLKKKYMKAKFFFSLLNPASCMEKKYWSFINQCYDGIISFDYGDCVKYGWIHYSGIYSRDNDIKNNSPLYDIFFVGNNKGRLEKIRTLYDCLTKNGLKCDFYISKVEASDCRDDGIHYNEYLSYSEVIEHIKNSKSILEVLQENQRGSSLRTMESLVYKRVLITNNRDVMMERYYTEDHFYVIDNLDNIDLNEILRRCGAINTLEYNGEVSPYLFLDFLSKNI